MKILVPRYAPTGRCLYAQQQLNDFLEIPLLFSAFLYELCSCRHVLKQALFLSV